MAQLVYKVFVLYTKVLFYFWQIKPVAKINKFAIKCNNFHQCQKSLAVSYLKEVMSLGEEYCNMKLSAGFNEKPELDLSLSN